MMRIVRLAVVLCALLGCGRDPVVLPAEGHIVVHVDTDAWVPSSGSPSAAERPPLFDSLLIEVFGPDDTEPCASCVQQLALHAKVLEEGGSFTVLSGGAREGVVVRLSMFLAAHRHGSTIDPRLSVQITARLPTIPVEGAVNGWLFLPTDAVGAPMGTLDAPVMASSTALEGPSKVRTWPGGRQVDCKEPPLVGEVCVPGGAFWMGNLRAHESDPEPQSTGRRLVTLAPFYMDAREVTVADLRAPKIGNLNQHIAPWSGDELGDAIDDWCSYSVSPDPAREALPMNCIAWGGANAYCEAIGSILPSEAQFEYVAGALEGRDFVWGTEVPACSDAVWGRATGVAATGGSKAVCDSTLAPGELGGPLALPDPASPQSLPAPRSRDVLILPTGAIFDLAGNVGEWSRDWFQGRDSACWRPDGPNLLHDPVCEEPSDSRSFRGGYHSGGAITLLAAERHLNDPVGALNEVGFRCVRPAQPAPP